MGRIRFFSVVVVTLACLAAWAAAGADETGDQQFRWRGQVSAGRTVEIKGVNGDIRADAATAGEVEVLATKQGRRSDPKLVEIKVVEHSEGVTICAVYPSDDPDKPNECRPGKGGRLGARNNDVRVDFTVRVPAGLHFSGNTVNGQIEAHSLKGDVKAQTINGGVRVSTSGNAQAKSVNGSIEASMGSAGWTNPVDFSTVNGSVTVALPASANTDVTAETVNGVISTDFPVTVQGTFNGQRMHGTIGSGGRELTLKSVNGSIRLRRQSGP